MPECDPGYTATPEEIAADQRAAVAEALGRLGPAATAAAIGDDCVLPAFNIRRRLSELGLTCAPDPEPAESG